MTILFVILIVLSCAILALIVLIQNPKGGGLAGNIAGFSNQFMGVKQTTDVLEKGTWVFAGIVAVLCLASTFFISKTSGGQPDETKKVGTTVPVNNQPATNSNTAPFQTNPQGANRPDSTKK
ncbi:MAG TPA: preprotein translocase subunit SecG [Chitinophagaceae bacterium]|nr:preprotein translocase subunit SecG [Chitinophagaceae bacterium]